ncbi:MAG: NifB/NifX family molybdenum-iron cluster-binding protein [Candidatus Hodarchaeales archaeon]|jgi:predicted Fe-Mo cluster-binding NifX family protein
MKLALPTLPPGGLESSINPHFGKCETVTFVTVENQEIQNTTVVTPQGEHSCAALPAIFAQNGADICLVGGIGGRPYMILQQYGIKTYHVNQDLINKPVKEVVDFFLTNQLTELENASCNDHGH